MCVCVCVCVCVYVLEFQCTVQGVIILSIMVWCPLLEKQPIPSSMTPLLRNVHLHPLLILYRFFFIMIVSYQEWNHSSKISYSISRWMTRVSGLKNVLRWTPNINRSKRKKKSLSWVNGKKEEKRGLKE